MAYLQQQALGRRAAYVDQGRRYQPLPNERLEADWADAFVAMCLHGEQARIRDLDDLTAEIGLRGRPLPAHLVRHVMPDVAERARQWLGATFLARFAGRVREFVASRAES
jgi:hypothetical protein